MVELALKCRKLPRLTLMHSTKREQVSQPSLGSGINASSTRLSNSIIHHNHDPYMPNIAKPQRSSSASLPKTSRPPKLPMRHCSSSSPHLSLRSMVDSHQHCYYPPASPASPSNNNTVFCYNYPPASPPPLSPTNLSFSNSSRPSWRELARSPTYQPASSISSTDDDDEQEQEQSDDDDDDDDAPLGLMLSPRSIYYGKPFSLLSDLDEDGDDDLVPIAKLCISRENVHHMSAAEKYKQKVRAKLRMDSSSYSS